MKTKTTALPLQDLCTIARRLAQTFAPFCEVVVHDLTTPEQTTLAIENNLSEREIGQPATELGLARIKDSSYPEIVANYPSAFADGRKVKSTSIEIKDNEGNYVAKLCLNVDLTLFQGFQSAVSQFTATEATDVTERLDSFHSNQIHRAIDEFTAALAKTPRSLKLDERRQLMQGLRKTGHLEIRCGAEIAAAYLGVSRATVYSDSKD
ncbi:MAG: transcriptional regulator [Pseudomonas sp.]|nr:MAG: transcriptional regulator [Pseudomonas sp.]